jgi:hypothetical protein
LDTEAALYLRDRLTVVLGWAMMARRSELARLDLTDLIEVSGGVNIMVFSYDAYLDVGIVVDRETVPDVWDFTDYMRDALAEL